MNTLILRAGDYKNFEILSRNFPFCVYKATDKSGKNVVIKTLFDLEQTITSAIEAYKSNHSNDLLTSVFYSHGEADKSEIKGEELLTEQYNYLCQCSENYNLTNCFLGNDDNGKPFLIYDFVEGQNLYEFVVSSKSDLFSNMIPALLMAVSKYPHGDLSFTNLIIQENGRKFSIIDPAVKYGNLFFTNTEYYPLVPPLFHTPINGYATYADQLAIALMLYKLLTGTNPLKRLSEFPFWTNSFGNGIGNITDDIYSVISVLPESWKHPYFFVYYIHAVKSQLRKGWRYIPSNSEFISGTGKNIIDLPPEFFQIKPPGTGKDIIDFPLEFFQIKSPVDLNHNIPKGLSDFCMSLIFNYEPIDWYIYKIMQLTAAW